MDIGVDTATDLSMGMGVEMCTVTGGDETGPGHGGEARIDLKSRF